MQTKNCAAKLKIENISMQIKNEKSCARSLSDEDLVLHGQFLICNNIFNLQVKFLVAATFSICMCDPSGPPYDLEMKHKN